MTLPSPLCVVQLTDIHLFAETGEQLLGLPTIESFQRVVQQIAALQPSPDLIVLTGDLSQDGKPRSYQNLKELLQPLNLPIYWLPGNHDFLPALEQTFAGGTISASKSFEARGWRFLLLNSQVPGCVHGCLAEESLAWLQEQLNLTADQPTIVGFHHPPFLVGSNWLDGSALQNPEDLFAVLDRHSQVKLVLFGHIHQDYSQQRGTVQYLGSPSTCIQFEPHSSNFALDTAKPGFRLLHLFADGTWKTEVKRVDYAYQCDLAATGY